MTDAFRFVEYYWSIIGGSTYLNKVQIVLILMKIPKLLRCFLINLLQLFLTSDIVYLLIHYPNNKTLIFITKLILISFYQNNWFVVFIHWLYRHYVVIIYINLEQRHGFIKGIDVSNAEVQITVNTIFFDKDYVCLINWLLLS